MIPAVCPKVNLQVLRDPTVIILVNQRCQNVNSSTFCLIHLSRIGLCSDHIADQFFEQLGNMDG